MALALEPIHTNQLCLLGRHSAKLTKANRDPEVSKMFTPLEKPVTGIRKRGVAGAIPLQLAPPLRGGKPPTLVARTWCKTKPGPLPLRRCELLQRDG